MAIRNRGFKLVEMTKNQTLTSNSYVTVFQHNQTANIHELCISLQDMECSLTVEVDGVAVINNFALDDLIDNQVYNFSSDFRSSTSIISFINNNSFAINLEMLAKESFVVKLKNRRTSSKKMMAGFTTMTQIGV